ncbi:hypothetical protein NDN08_000267 [Rhodosorus marinus]|uniref:Reverse transcriptase Ty1/copia-type domain-containing protein n=1 Tax=Rhodosorus marinus TaxID=101924 RepID=A0AAV8UEQ1_9RHOD|nr:hypothetical protein NDN08_000267 [Rhodosorus marinus]
MYAVRGLSAHLHDYTGEDWRSAKRVLRYLQGTDHMTLSLGNKPHKTEVAVYADASWAESEDRKSGTGVCIYLHGALVIYYSRRQRPIATSSSEAEYVATAEGVKSLRWLQQLLVEEHQASHYFSTWCFLSNSFSEAPLAQVTFSSLIIGVSTVPLCRQHLGLPSCVQYIVDINQNDNPLLTI